MGVLTRRGGNASKCCHVCGATRTTKGQPITGNYCSPICLNRARHRPDSYGANTSGRGYEHGISLSDEDDSGKVYNPFDELFDVNND